MLHINFTLTVSLSFDQSLCLLVSRTHSIIVASFSEDVSFYNHVKYRQLI